MWISLYFGLFFPKFHNASLTMKKKLYKFHLRGVLQNIWLVLFKTVKTAEYRCTPIISALGRLRQEDLEFGASQGYQRPCLKTKKVKIIKKRKVWQTVSVMTWWLNIIWHARLEPGTKKGHCFLPLSFHFSHEVKALLCHMLPAIMLCLDKGPKLQGQPIIGWLLWSHEPK
jgi:hypothetical protein